MAGARLAVVTVALWRRMRRTACESIIVFMHIPLEKNERRNERSGDSLRAGCGVPGQQQRNTRFDRRRMWRTQIDERSFAPKAEGDGLNFRRPHGPRRRLPATACSGR
jgi:hypothetical protein